MLDQRERVVDPLGDVGLGGGGKQLLPACVLRDPEHVLADVLVSVLQDLGDLLGILDVAVAVWVAEFRLQFATAQLERVGDVLQEQRLSSPFGGDSAVRERDLDAGAAEVLPWVANGLRGRGRVGGVRVSEEPLNDVRLPLAAV